VKAANKILNFLKINCCWEWNFIYDGCWTAFIYSPTQRDA